MPDTNPTAPNPSNQFSKGGQWLLVGIIGIVALGASAAGYGAAPNEKPEATPIINQSGGDLATGCGLNTTYIPYFNQAIDGAKSSEKLDLPVALIAAIYHPGEHPNDWGEPPTSTNWTCNTTSGACGPFQTMKATWDRYGQQNGQGDFIPANYNDFKKSARTAAEQLAADYKVNGNSMSDSDAKNMKARFSEYGKPDLFNPADAKILQTILLYNPGSLTGGDTAYIPRVYEAYLNYKQCASANGLGTTTTTLAGADTSLMKNINWSGGTLDPTGIVINWWTGTWTNIAPDLSSRFSPKIKLASGLDKFCF